jgi:phenylacetate-coenzyme A ligase PaaK-like adenylate-forming protein
MARCYRMAGARPGDATQITPLFGLFNGGFGMYHGARATGLFVIPAGPGNTARQIRLARDLKTRVFTGVVSYGVRLMEILVDEYIIEIIDPKTGEAVDGGEEGELVFTSLTREALPMIRFRMADLTRIISRDTCECGRTHLKIAPITGRRDDMLIVKGVNFFPKQIEQTLLGIPGIGNNYQIIVEEVDGVNDVRVNVEAGRDGLHGGKGAQRGAGFLTQGRRVFTGRTAQTGREGQEGVSREDR